MGAFQAEGGKNQGQGAAQKAHVASHSICWAGLHLASAECPAMLRAGLWNWTDLLQLLDLRPVAQPLKASVALSVK